MNVLVVLMPVSLLLGGLGLLGFLWTLRAHQYDDPDGDKSRILNSRWDAKPNER